MNNAWRIIDRDLKPENIKAGVNIYGVTGTLRTECPDYRGTGNGKNYWTLLNIEDIGSQYNQGYWYESWALGSNYVSWWWYYPFAFNSWDKYYFWGLRKRRCTNNCTGMADTFHICRYTLDKVTKTINYEFIELAYATIIEADTVYEVSPITNWLDYWNELRIYLYKQSSRSNLTVAACFIINKTTGAVTMIKPNWSNERWVVSGKPALESMPEMWYDNTKPRAVIEPNSVDWKIYKGAVLITWGSSQYSMLVGYDKF